MILKSWGRRNCVKGPCKIFKDNYRQLIEFQEAHAIRNLLHLLLRRQNTALDTELKLMLYKMLSHQHSHMGNIFENKMENIYRKLNIKYAEILSICRGKAKKNYTAKQINDVADCMCAQPMTMKISGRNLGQHKRECIWYKGQTLLNFIILGLIITA